MKILFATHNDNKINELKAILKEQLFIIYSLKDLMDSSEVEETGKTFKENAILKAKHYCEKHNLITIADDSGLEVFKLNKRPGIYSKRYSNKGDYENNKKVLSELIGIKNRKAQFVSVIAIYDPNKKIKTFKGIVKGKIAYEISGDKGFGYDSIFIPKRYNETFGTLDSKTKNTISHRYKALMKGRKYINDTYYK